MFSKAIVATDLSPASDGILRCMKGLIPLGTKKVVLVHAIGIPELAERQWESFIRPRCRSW